MVLFFKLYITMLPMSSTNRHKKLSTIQLSHVHVSFLYATLLLIPLNERELLYYSWRSLRIYEVSRLTNCNSADKVSDYFLGLKTANKHVLKRYSLWKQELATVEVNMKCTSAMKPENLLMPLQYFFIGVKTKNIFVIKLCCRRWN